MQAKLNNLKYLGCPGSGRTLRISARYSALLFPLVVFCILFTAQTDLFAQSLVITDCQGLTRAVKNVDPGSLNKVEVNVTNASGVPANGTEITMTNVVTGETTVAIAQNGLVTFENVPAGTFSLSTTATDITVGVISVGSGAGVVAATGAAFIAGGAAAGAGAAAVVVIDNEIIDDSKSSGSGPTPTPEPSVAPENTPTPVPPAPTPTPHPCRCDPDAEPTPIGPFLNPEETLPPAEEAKTGKQKAQRPPMSPYN